MRKFLTIGCAYLLLFCVPLHLVAGSSDLPLLASGTVEADSPAEFAISEDAGFAEVEAETSEEAMAQQGPGKNKKKRHRQKRKRMGNHQNLSDKLSNIGIFGSQKKKSGIGQSVLFLVVPAVAVVGIAFLFANNTQEKNATPEPDLLEN